MKFATSIAAHGKQREVFSGCRGEVRLPDFYQQFIEELDPFGNDVLDIFPRPVAVLEIGIFRSDAVAQFKYRHVAKKTLQSVG